MDDNFIHLYFFIFGDTMRRKNEREANKTDNGFYYLDIGSEDHGKPSFRLWVSSKLITESDIYENREVVKFPISALIHKTEKGNYVLRPDNEVTTFDILIHCGYRGRSEIEVVGNNDEQRMFYFVYESPRGSCGVSTGVLVSTKKEVEIRWARSGRLYGRDSEGRCKLIPSEKKVIRLVDVVDPELCDILQE